jgi:hypothetical protein
LQLLSRHFKSKFKGQKYLIIRFTACGAAGCPVGSGWLNVSLRCLGFSNSLFTFTNVHQMLPTGHPAPRLQEVYLSNISAVYFTWIPHKRKIKNEKRLNRNPLALPTHRVEFCP